MYNRDAMDTLRVLVSWKCNLRCSYCCNNLPDIRAGIRPVRLEDLDFAPYKVVCITGGEPLLAPGVVRDVCHFAKGRFLVLYTNGTKLTPELAGLLANWGVNAINVGLHKPGTFGRIIRNVRRCTEGLPLSVRFHMEDKYTDLARRYPGVQFRFWHRGECERTNEDRVVLEENV